MREKSLHRGNGAAWLGWGLGDQTSLGIRPSSATYCGSDPRQGTYPLPTSVTCCIKGEPQCLLPIPWVYADRSKDAMSALTIVNKTTDTSRKNLTHEPEFPAMHHFNQIPCLLCKIIVHFCTKFQTLHLDFELPFCNGLTFRSFPSLNSDLWNILNRIRLFEDRFRLGPPGPGFKARDVSFIGTLSCLGFPPLLQ